MRCTRIRLSYALTGFTRAVSEKLGKTGGFFRSRNNQGIYINRSGKF